jgi:hypothetical protein
MKPVQELKLETETVCPRTTHLLPPGRARMRYLNIRSYWTPDNPSDGKFPICCGECRKTLLTVHNEAAVIGLAVKCPHCGAVSEV